MKNLVAFLKFLCLAGFVLAGFIFALRNSAATSLWFGMDFAPRPLGLWLLIAFAGGGLLGLALGAGIFRNLRLLWRVRRLESQLQDCRQELAALRCRPDEDRRGAGD